MGGILATTLRLYARFPVLFLALALVVFAPFDLIVLAATGHGPLGERAQNVGTWLLLTLLHSTLVTGLISALHVHAVAMIGQGQRPRPATVAVRGLRVLPVVVAAEIMATLGIGLGFLALIIPGIVLSIRWAVVAQAAAVENEGWLPALRSSARLADGSYGRIVGLLLLIGLFGFGVNRAASAIHFHSSVAPASVATGIATDTLVASFAALAVALLYFDLRARRAGPRPVGESEQPHLRDLD